MQQKKILFFKKEKYNFYFFAIPLVILIVLGTITLILTADYQIDFKIAEILSIALQYDFFKYLTTIYDYLGYTELIVVIIIYIAILIEL